MAHLFLLTKVFGLKLFDKEFLASYHVNTLLQSGDGITHIPSINGVNLDTWIRIIHDTDTIHTGVAIDNLRNNSLYVTHLVGCKNIEAVGLP